MKSIKKVLIVIGILGINVFTLSAQPEIIAHRGFWDYEGSAQNSIFALAKAQQFGFYGSEFDVYITQDGRLVVNHDNTINGLLIEDTPYKKLKNIKLSNGEKLPTLEKYFKQGKKNKNVRLILEIKPHSTKEKEDAAVAGVLQMVKRFGLEKQVEYISFSINICKTLRESDPEAIIAYLNGDLPPTELKALSLSGLDYNVSVFQRNPEWVSEAKQLGLTVNVWTVNNESQMREMIALGVDYITTDKPLLLREIIKSEVQ